MKSAILIFCSGLVIGGGLFALGRASVPTVESAVAESRPAAAHADERVAALERQVEMLTQALDGMGRSAVLPPARKRTTGSSTGEGDRASAQEPADSRDPLAPRMIQLLEDDEAFRERMREIFQADRRERREVNSAKRFVRWMERLTEKLEEAELEGLSANQQADLEGILEEERQQVRSGFRRARRGELTWDEARDQAIKFRELSNEKIKPILGDEQFAVFDELRRRARGPR
ncbi:MAG: hypothetical protein CMH55_10205 [Myxococcales bacterium]|nr:hypothetical protein [Myxococcales bacterium]